MLLIVLGLFWVALLAPIVVRRFRDNGTEKSIQSFHAEHEVLSRQDYAVTPAHRLDQPDQAAPGNPPARSRLTVVHADDTYGSLESRASWDEWSEDYEYDARRPGILQPNRYAKAYSSRPSESAASEYHAPIRRRTMRAQRRMVFTRLVLVALVMSVVAFVSGNSILVDVTAVTWLAVVGFIAMAFYAVSQGYLNDSSLPLHLPKLRPLATIEPLHGDDGDLYEARYEDEFTSEFYEPDADEQWRREPLRHRALG